MRRETSAPFPANDLEVALQRAHETDDRAYLLRALARSTLCLARPAEPAADPHPGRPRLTELDLTRRPLPLADGKDGRAYLLVFTSSFRLFDHYRDEQTTWMQTAAGYLAGVATEVAWIVNLGHPVSVVLQPVDVVVIADLAAGRPVIEALTGGAASRLTLSTPDWDVHGLRPVLAPVLGGDIGRSRVERVVGALVRWDEPGSGSWLRVGLVCDEPDAAGAVDAKRQVIAAMEAATPAPVEVRLVSPRPALAVDRWLLEHGAVVWVSSP